MNKRAKEKQLLEEAYIQVLEEQSESKAPKGKSFNKKDNYKPSNVDASKSHTDQYVRIRKNEEGRSKKTHGGRGVQDEEEKGGIKIGDHVYKVGSNDPLGSGKISTIIEYSNGYMIFTRDEYGGLMSHMVDLEGQAVDEGYLKNKDGESYSKEEAAEDKVYDHIDGLINIKDKERLVHLFKLAIADPRILDLDVVTSIHDDLKKEGFDVDDINDYIAETFKFTLGG